MTKSLFNLPNPNKSLEFSTSGRYYRMQLTKDPLLLLRHCLHVELSNVNEQSNLNELLKLSKDLYKKLCKRNNIPYNLFVT